MVDTTKLWNTNPEYRDAVKKAAFSPDPEEALNRLIEFGLTLEQAVNEVREEEAYVLSGGYL